MVTMLVASALACAIGADASPAEPARVGSIFIQGNRWTADCSILDALELWPAMRLPDEATLLRTEIRLLMQFHERFDLTAGKRPTLKVLPCKGGIPYHDIVVHFPEKRPGKVPALKAEDLTGPKRVYHTYIEAVRKGDSEAARRCWVVKDDIRSGALEVLVDFWIAPRQLYRVAFKKFGEAGVQAIPKGWGRDDLTDRSFRLARRRLADAKVEVRGDVAILRIGWMRRESEAFGYGESTVRFRKVAGKWKMDAKIDASDLAPGTWGSLFREQTIIMKEAIDGMKRGRLKTPNQLKAFLDEKLKAMVEQYEQQRKRRGGGLPVGNGIQTTNEC
jgi:hypothetical protein